MKEFPEVPAKKKIKVFLVLTEGCFTVDFECLSPATELSEFFEEMKQDFLKKKQIWAWRSNHLYFGVQYNHTANVC